MTWQTMWLATAMSTWLMAVPDSWQPYDDSIDTEALGCLAFRLALPGVRILISFTASTKEARTITIYVRGMTLPDAGTLLKPVEHLLVGLDAGADTGYGAWYFHGKPLGAS